jgi:hypothetical protein
MKLHQLQFPSESRQYYGTKMRPLASDAQKHDRWNKDGGGSVKDRSPKILVTVVTFLIT